MKIKTPLLVMFALITEGTICCSQGTVMDSLLTVLNNSKEDTNKVNVLNLLSDKCEVADILKYAIPALRLSEKLNFQNGIADAANNVGYAFSETGNFTGALESYQKSLKINEVTGDTFHIAQTLNNIGSVYNKIGDINLALDYFLKSLKLREEIGDKKSTAKSLDNIGLFYKSQGDIPNSFEYLQKSLTLREEIGEKDDIAMSLINIGYIYQDQGNSAEAIKYFEKSLNILEQTGNTQRLAFSLHNIGWNYFNQGRYDKALDYYEKSLSITEKSGDKNMAAATFNGIGKTYLEQKNFKKAVEFSNQSLAISKNIGVPERIKNASETLSKIYSEEGNYKEAFQMHVLFKQMADSINNQETRKATVKKQMQYEFDKKEVLAKAEIKRQTLIRNSTLGGVGIAGIFSFLLVRSVNRRKKTAFNNQVSQVEMKALRAQMNPHFIFNSLNSIHSFIQQNKGEKASDYLIKFSRLMRLILENSNHEEVPLESDLEALSLYMELEAARMNNKFTFSIDVAEEIDAENTLVPPLILQPFVENSIWHGMMHKEENGLIRINISKNGDMIKCIVQDNGVGREKAKELKSATQKGKHNSLGMKITNERIAIINRIKKSKAFVDLKDLHDETNRPLGTLVEVQLPFETSF